MKKLSHLLTLVIIALLATGIGFADANDKSVPTKRVSEVQENFNINKSFVSKPADFLLNTTNDTVVISGEGKANDKISITLFRKSDNEYLQMGDAIEISIGEMGRFSKEVSLKDTQVNSPREAIVSKETFIIFELKRGANTNYDYRLIKYADEREIKESLRTASLVSAIKK